MGGYDFSQYCSDFDLLLESIYPHKQFTEFLRMEGNGQLLPLLSVIRKTKLLRAMQEDLEVTINESVVQQRGIDISSVGELKDNTLITNLEQ